MSVTQFTDVVEIEGNQDVAPLKVQGTTSQTKPLQPWKTDSGDMASQISNGG